MDNLRITFVGDLKHGRTVHSLSRLLAQCYKNVQITYVAPGLLFFYFILFCYHSYFCIDHLQMPKDLLEKLKNRLGSQRQLTTPTGSFLQHTDVLYGTQKITSLFYIKINLVVADG